MSIITLDELARGAALVVFGGAAGACTVAFPGSPLWLLPAAVGVFAGAATVPEVRAEVRTAWPQIAEALQMPALPAPLIAAPDQASAPARSTPAPTPAQAAPVSAAPPAVLKPRQWLAALNDEPDRAPHSLIVGPSGAGKTTLATAILSKRQGQSVVLSPKVNAGNWRGAEVVSLDDDGSYGLLAAALGDLEAEKRQRITALRRGQPLAPLTVVLDETPELVQFVPKAGDFITSMASIGRELQIRLVVLSTSTRVAALGIKGRGDTLANFVRVDLDRDRQATLNDGMTTRPLDLGHAHTGAQRAQLRPWRGGEADFLAGLFLHVPSRSDAEGTVQERVPVPVPVPNMSGTGTRSDVIVTPGNGGTAGTVNVHVTATAATSAARLPQRRRRGQSRGQRFNVKGRSQRQAATTLIEKYRQAGIERQAFRKVYDALGGSKQAVFAAWQEGKRQAG